MRTGVSSTGDRHCGFSIQVVSPTLCRTLKRHKAAAAPAFVRRPLASPAQTLLNRSFQHAPKGCVRKRASTPCATSSTSPVVYDDDDDWEDGGWWEEDDDDYFEKDELAHAVPLSDGGVGTQAAAGASNGAESAAFLRRARVRLAAAAHISNTSVRGTWQQIRAGKRLEDAAHDATEAAWQRVLKVWEQPLFKRMRIAFSMVNIGVRLPALVALVFAQISLLASQVSLPMLAPLLLGTGMMLRSIQSNATIIFPRLGVLVVLCWMLWFANSVVQNTTLYLRRQGALDHRVSGFVITMSECTAMLAACVVLLTMLGVNVSALLLPAGIAAALACRDVLPNYLAGFFLFFVQPFKVGDVLMVPQSNPVPARGAPTYWFEGFCEKVDLRYTIVRRGRQRLMIPNAVFINQQFVVLDGKPASPDHAAHRHAADDAAATHSDEFTPHSWPAVGGNNVGGKHRYQDAGDADSSFHHHHGPP